MFGERQPRFLRSLLREAIVAVDIVAFRLVLSEGATIENGKQFLIYAQIRGQETGIPVTGTMPFELAVALIDEVVFRWHRGDEVIDMRQFAKEA